VSFFARSAVFREILQRQADPPGLRTIGAGIECAGNAPDLIAKETSR
jgi:hypothetical protein